MVTVLLTSYYALIFTRFLHKIPRSSLLLYLYIISSFIFSFQFPIQQHLKALQLSCALLLLFLFPPHENILSRAMTNKIPPAILHTAPRVPLGSHDHRSWVWSLEVAESNNLKTKVERKGFLVEKKI